MQETLDQPLKDVPVDQIVKNRRPGRWGTGLVLIALVALLVRSVVTNKRFEWPVVGHYLGDRHIMAGVGLTLVLTAVCMVVGIVFGVLLAVMRISANVVAQSVAGAYIVLFRGTPTLVQLLLWYNISALYPEITFGVPGLSLDEDKLITPFVAAVLGLGLHEAAYMAEIIRGGIAAIDYGQSEAASALGLTRGQTLRRIVLPQAMAVIVPPTGNQIIGMLKTTSLVSVLAIGDLLYSAQLIYTKNFAVIPLLIVASIWYLCLTSVFTLGQHWVERYYARGRPGQADFPLRRSPRPTGTTKRNEVGHE